MEVAKTQKFAAEGKKLLERRLQLGMTQLQLAQKSGIDSTTISNFETGYRSFTRVQISTAEKIAKALDCKIDDLI